MTPASSRGFTLLELMVTIAIVGILLTIGVPSLRNTLLDQRARTATSDLHTSLTLARSEAIKRSASATVTPASGTTDWSGGWTVAAGGSTIRSQEAYSTITLTGPAATVTYNRTGRVAGGAAAFLAYAAGNNNVRLRCITLDASGKPNVKLDGDGDSSDLTCD